MKRSVCSVATLVGGLGAVLACGSQGRGNATPASGGTVSDAPSASSSPSAEAGAPEDGSADDSSAPSQAFLRIAQLSPDLPPVDVCVALHGTARFQGPLIAQLSGQDAGEDGGAPGLVYAQVSAYVPLDVGTYDVRLVAAGARDCSLPLPLPYGIDGADPDAASFADGSELDRTGADGDVEAEDNEPSGDEEMREEAAVDAGAFDATTAGDLDGTRAEAPGVDASIHPPGHLPDTINLPPLALNAFATLLVAGDFAPAAADAPLAIGLIRDDAELAGEATALRAVNAVPSAPSLDFGLGSFASTWLPLLTNVSFGAASAEAGTDDGVVDSNGYLPMAPLSAEVMSARASSGATSDIAVANDVTIETGSIATVVAVGGKTGDGVHPPALLLCIDNQPSGGFLSDCAIAR